MAKVVSFSGAAILLAAVFSTSVRADQPSQTMRVLPGHRSERLAHIQPAGDMDPSAQLSLAIGLPLHNSDQLQERIHQINDLASTNYNRHLTREQFTEQFSPTEGEYQKAIAYATAHGLKVTCTYPNRMLFDVTGSVADVEKVFHVRMRLYPHPTEKRHFFGPDSDPSVDLQFGILDVDGLNNFGLPHSLNLKSQPIGRTNIETYAQAGSGPQGGLVGNDFRNAYAPGVTLNGNGQSIAIVSLTPYFPQDVMAYQQIAGQANINITNISVAGFNTTPTTGLNDAETAGDIDLAASMAPAATIMVYEGARMVDVYNQIASDGLARQITCSYGEGDGSINQTLIGIISELQAQGQSSFIASGDSGANHLSILDPGGYTNETICGGTTLTLTNQGGGWQSETTWAGSGGGWYTNFAIPPYQQGLNMSTNHGSSVYRNSPDVSMVANDFLSIWGGSNVISIGGGTSGSSPLWAGFLALVNEQRADNGLPSVVNFNDLIYTIGKGANYTNAFHDITTGNTTNSISPTNYFAVAGYDLCTGWGTPNGTNLINLLAAGTDPLQISPGFGFSTSFAYGQSAGATNSVFTLKASGGSVSWQAGNAPSWLNLSSTGSTIASGNSTQVTASLVTSVSSALPVGTYQGNVNFTNKTSGAVQSRLFVLTVSAAAQPLAVTGFNASIVVPTSGTASQPNATGFDALGNYTFYAAGLPGSTRGLPASGRFVSGWDGQTIFQLGSYGSPNALVLGRNYSTSGTLALSSPQSLDSLTVLAASAFGQLYSQGTMVLNYSGGGHSQTFLFNAQDWFYTATNSALHGVGRIILNTFSVEDDGDANPNLYQTTIPLAALGITQAISSVTFTMPSTATNTSILALSAVTGPLSGLAPAITQQPQSVTNTTTTTGAEFSVGVSGAPPFTYQWYSNSVPLQDGVMSTLSFDPGVPASDAASYYVVVSNLFGSVQSSPATLAVIRVSPTIASQPANTNYTVFAGATLSFAVTASSLNSMSYSWKLNGASLSSATNATLVLTNIQAANAGSYQLSVSTVNGTTNSEVINLSVVPAPSASYPQQVLSLNPMAYWRLDETNGNIAYDYISGDNGVYTNVILGQPGYGAMPGTGTDPSELAAQFGPTNNAQSYVGLPNLDLSVPNGGNGEFAIAAWVRASNNVPSAAGIVAKGYGGGDEEFGLACGANGNAFQFFIRNAQSAAASVAGSSLHPDNNWHFLVGVCDQANSKITLYIDGTNAAQASVTPGTGIHHSTYQGSIGARASNTGTPEDTQFLGAIDDVAIFTNALSAAQVSILYGAGAYGPLIQQQPVALQKIQAGSAITNTVVATGTNLVYQWYGPAGAIANATNSSLVLSNFQVSQNGFYYVTVGNVYQTLQSSKALVFALPSVTTPYPRAVMALSPMAYWRLNETNGTTAYDYAGLNEGAYNDVALGQPGYDSDFLVKSDSGELAAGFVNNGTPSYISIPTIDLGPHSFGAAEFTISAWVKADPSVANGAGIIAKGAGAGDEEFCLDCGGANNAFRFFMRDIHNAASVAASTVVPDNHWHLLTGVCDESTFTLTLYIDGTNAASAGTSYYGLHASSVPASMGARESGAGQPENLQFVGELNDVAIFNTALSYAQVSSLYVAGAGLVVIQQQPPSAWQAVAGDTFVDQVVASGAGLNYQWYGPGGGIASATNSSLVLSNVSYANAGNYYVVVSNLIGRVQSVTTALQVVSPKPYQQLVASLKPMSFWRLDEVGGNVAYDYVGGDNGVYENVSLGQPSGIYSSTVAAQFGTIAQSYVSLPNLDLSVPNGGNGEFAIAAWVRASSNASGGSIMAKGYGGGDEEFGLTCGANGNAFQFFIRNAQSGAASVANSSVLPDNNWHFLVGVCDQANSQIVLYVDGTNAANASVVAGTGIHYSTYQGSIGARSSSAGAFEDLQYVGLIDGVAIFTNALTAGQIVGLYNAVASVPMIQQQPVSQRLHAGDTVTEAVVATGNNLVYQWYGPAGAIAGATNSSLVFTNAQPVQTGNYYVTVGNANGAVQSANAQIIVLPIITSPFGQGVLALNPLAYWRLNETNGTTAYDYANQNDGTYNNVVLGQPAFDSAFPVQSGPGDFSAQFVTNGQPSYVSIPTINFVANTGYNIQLSIAAWVKADPSVASGAAIIAKGDGIYDTQFAMNCGGPNNSFQFYTIENEFYSDSATSSVVPDNKWHFLVGVLDENNGSVALYIDGALAVSRTIGGWGGIHTSSVPASIGASDSAPGHFEDLQFVGELEDVAMFQGALSAAQISYLYNAAKGIPQIVQQPAPVWIGYQGTTVSNSVYATGVALTYQWFGPSGLIPNATNSTLVLSNLIPANTGSYYVIVSNSVATVQSGNAVLTVEPPGQYQSAFNNYASGATVFLDGSQLFSTALGSVGEIVANLQTPAELQLTEIGQPGQSAFELPDLNPGSLVYAFSAKWNSQVNGDFANSQAADGFSFNFGQLNSLNLINGNAESGYPTGLCFSAQTFVGNNPGFYLRLNGNTLASQPYDPGVLWGENNATRHYFEIDWNYTNGMTARMDHQMIFTNIATPGFVPHVGDRFVWAARCGQYSEEMRLANIAVVTGGNLAPAPAQSPYFADANTLASDPASNAFAANISTPWETATNSAYVGATVSPSVPLMAYALTSSTNTSYDPQIWTLQGSANAGATWSNVDGETGYFVNGQETRAWLTTNASSSYGAYRLDVATNDGGGITAVQQLSFYQFNAVPGPFVITEAPSQVTYSTAQLNGQANAGPAPTAAWFRWGTSASYGNTTSVQNVGSNNVSFSAALTGLTPNGIYHSQAVISNQYGVFFGADMAFTTVINPVAFGGNGVDWSSNQSGAYMTPTIANNVLHLTDGTGSEGRSVFFEMPQYIGAFKASFTYQDVGGGGADGVAFVLQNDPRGTSALGGIGGSLGYGPANPITPSAALELNVYTGGGQIVGYTFLTNGLLGAGGANGNYHAPGTINLGSGHPINIAMNYANAQLALSFTDTVSTASFSTNLSVPNLTNVVGSSTAYIGFTGGDGGTASTQIITNFSFVSIPTETISVTAGQAVISWPAAIAGFTLQQNSNPTTTNWVDLTNQPTVVNGQNQFTVPLTVTNEFYRLKLP